MMDGQYEKVINYCKKYNDVKLTEQFDSKIKMYTNEKMIY